MAHVTIDVRSGNETVLRVSAGDAATPYIFIPSKQRTIYPFEVARADLLNEMSPWSFVYNVKNVALLK